jgi:hypothetical protein
MKIKQKQFAVIFKHTDGWTISAVENSKDASEIEMNKQKEVCPNFKYRIVPCTVEFNVVSP